ncbi:hypothetical protein SAMN05192529_13338 [Arachidicoccus rhizosphaerae]|uniref:Uncharacterized protein n=1 Tax=Arachidicoccus rhizosphaerae TaxID=551991 RepID=A0A1H4CMI2_9BACT|nr:hypothetical protein SAMN05192529_13338 [Arachidicoccus rhizosphaerae]
MLERGGPDASELPQKEKQSEKVLLFRLFFNAV